MVRRADPVTITCLLPTLYRVQSTYRIRSTEHYARFDKRAHLPVTGHGNLSLGVYGVHRIQYTTQLPRLYRVNGEFYRRSFEYHGRVERAMLHPTSTKYLSSTLYEAVRTFEVHTLPGKSICPQGTDLA